MMTSYVALLRAVNVGGTGKLAMADLKSLCEAAGFTNVRTYIASGNVVFRSGGTEDQVRLDLAARLHVHAGHEIRVLVREAADMAAVVKRNPFQDMPPNQVVALFVDRPLPADPLAGVTGLGTERVSLGQREIFVAYPDGMARSRLRIPAETEGTARNMNTIAKLAGMAGAI